MHFEKHSINVHVCLKQKKDSLKASTKDSNLPQRKQKRPDNITESSTCFVFVFFSCVLKGDLKTMAGLLHVKETLKFSDFI